MLLKHKDTLFFKYSLNGRNKPTDKLNRINSPADPHCNVDLDPDLGSPTNADPNPVQTLSSQKR
jgi:hypothetical protein